MKDAGRIFDFLAARAAAGEKTALVTLIHVVGSSSRAIGTHMAVGADGASIGSFSGGCVEAAIVGEARRVMASGCAEVVRFGAGSRFIDVRLPCGGGIDVLITPNLSAGFLARVAGQLDARRTVSLLLGKEGEAALGNDCGAADAMRGNPHYVVEHEPGLRIVVIGHGEEVLAMVRQSLAYRAEVRVLTPDEAVAAAARPLGADAGILKTATTLPDLVIDGHTAVVMLFHDHDWEENMLIQAASSDAFYVGAMGSRATHAKRLDGLERRGLGAASRARIRGPIGRIPASRDPDTLALSVLAEIVEVQRRRALPDPREAAARQWLGPMTSREPSEPHKMPVLNEMAPG